MPTDNILLRPVPIAGFAMKFEDLARHLQPPEGLRRENWSQHPNGGGWVEFSATVAPTAFVGPDAIVTDEAKVLDKARIDGSAIVGGNAIVADESVVTDKARVNEMAMILGRSHIGREASVGGYAIFKDKELYQGSVRPLSHRDRTAWRRAQPYADSAGRSADRL